MYKKKHVTLGIHIEFNVSMEDYFDRFNFQLSCLYKTN